MNIFLRKAASWYFSKAAMPYWTVLFIDCLLVLVGCIVGFIINHGGVQTLSVFWPLMGTLAVYLCCFLAAFRIFHTYSGVIRYSSFIDLWRLGTAMLTGLVLVAVVQLLSSSFGWLYGGVVFGDVILGVLIALALMWTVRIWVKTLYDNSLRLRKTQNVFIYGVRTGGVAIAKSINTSDSSPYTIKGFVSDARDMKGRYLMGHPVYGTDEGVIETMKRMDARTLIVSPLKSEALRRNGDLVAALLTADVKIMMLPDVSDWKEGDDMPLNEFHEVSPEDLLPRDKIEVDMEAIGNMLRGKRILITGAAGSIGSEMVRQVAPYEPSELVLVDQAETPLHDIRLMMARQWPALHAPTIVADIAHRERMEDIFATYKPEYVFHAAAYKHVPMMEDNPEESITNNVEGTRVVADLAVKYGTRKFVMVSTDKAVNPTNVMGCSKRICEIYVQSLDKAIKEGRVKGETDFVTTRFGNVLGSNGSVIPLFQKQIREGGPVTVTHPDIIRFFMLIPEACKLVLEAGAMGNGGEIYVFDMGEPVRIADLARRMIKMSGAKDIEIKFTGLRDGEKLYEEVLNDKEVTLPTPHPKIKVAKVREYDYAKVNEDISAMVTLCREDAGDMAVVRAMKGMVPEFRSQHSKYVVLDDRPERNRM